MNRPTLILAIVAALLGVGVAAVAAYTLVEEPYMVVVPEEQLAPVIESEVEEPAVLAYGKVTLMLGQQAVFKDVRIRPLEVVDDSRCPMNARCIWAGTVRVRTEIVSAMGTSTDIIELGKSVTTEAEEVMLFAVTPDTMAGDPIENSEYRFTYSVGKRVTATPVGECYVGGCSSQLCSDTPDMVSTCEYREEYGCYQTARCERQTTGKCGWTMTNALQMCLTAAQATS